MRNNTVFINGKIAWIFNSFDIDISFFRDLIETLKRDGVLRSVSRGVDPRYELIAVMRAVQKDGMFGRMWPPLGRGREEA